MAAAIASRDATSRRPRRDEHDVVAAAITLPTEGNWRFTAVAFDTRGRARPVATGATGSYRSTRTTVRRPERHPGSAAE